MNNLICPCIFIRESKIGFSIVAIHIDDLNLKGTPEGLTKAAIYLKREFAMKNLEKIKFYLGLNIEHFREEIFLH